MLKIKVTEKSGAWIEYQSETMIDPSQMGHGQPERPEIGQDGQPTGNMLPADYTVEVIDITDQVEQEQVNKEALEYLNSTDWKVLRHIRQKALGEETSLTEAQYLELEQSRSDAAKRIVK